METIILWAGRAYYSLENCGIVTTEQGYIINSSIIGYYEEKIYRVEYRIQADEHWHTQMLDIHCIHDHQQFSNLLQSDGHGHWTHNGMAVPELDGCLDVDIRVTPFTNTLPIRRLNLEHREAKEIKVVYCDVLTNNIHPAAQRYTCLSDTAYQYENVHDDFKAIIQTDRSGFVVDYPELFVRKAVSTRPWL
ncbi:putative glycolipid-binding domain-containing protein [Nostoc ellipsosporum NOK]|nr:putative glycolipid-binding domain-containing protein [Nostoc ellipsosporum NOK]